MHNSLPIMLDTGSVLDEVLVLGYPNIPGYHPALTAEKALLSARLTAMNGAIASSSLEIFSQKELLLVTSRVRGGFSGGPVFGANGACVGVISRASTHDADDIIIQRYDDLGYGTAIPSIELANMLKEIQDNTQNTIELIQKGEIKWVDL